MKLFLIHVGFYSDEMGIYEMHTNMLVVAPDAKTAREQAKTKPQFQAKKMHIDGILELSNVDGYRIHLEKTTAETTDANQLFGYDAVKALA